MNPLKENNNIVVLATHSPEKVNMKRSTKAANTTKPSTTKRSTTKPNTTKKQNIPKVSKKLPNSENTKITAFYTTGKSRTEATVQTSAKKKLLPDIYLKKLEDPVLLQQKSSNDSRSLVDSAQSEDVFANRPDEQDDQMMGPDISSLLDYIVKLEFDLDEEKKAKETIASDYRLLKRKYVSNLQALVKAQQMLISHRGSAAIAIEEPVLLAESVVDVNKYVSGDNMEALKLIDGSKRRDAEFIRKLLSMMYDKEVLINKSVSGRLSRKKNDAMTPEKIKFIQNIFAQRIEKCCSDVEDKVTRSTETNINRLVANAISNIKRSKSCN